MIVLTFFIGKNLLTKQEMRIDNGAVSTGTISSKSAASRNKLNNKTTASADATLKKKKASTASMTTVATTTKKSRSGESVGHKEKDEMIKIVMRRLPAQMTKDELWEQLQPLPNEPQAFWFCPSNQELRPYAFSRAYIAFKEEKDAISFAERFNGYVFVDKQGNESMTIVECAPNQHVPKKLGQPAKECDARSGTLENELQYQQFLAQFEAQMATTSTRRVINFDELVHELEEKERRLEAGQVQETPLMAYINRLTLDKNVKKQQRSNERIERKQQKYYSGRLEDWDAVATIENKYVAKTTRTDKWPELSRTSVKIDDGKSSTTAAKTTNKKEAATAGSSSGHKNKDSKKRTPKATKKNTTSAPAGSSGGNENKDPPEHRSDRNRLSQQSQNQSTDKEDIKKQTPKATKKNTTSTGGTGSNKNKDRPEREIYRPGRNRVRQQSQNQPPIKEEEG